MNAACAICKGACCSTMVIPIRREEMSNDEAIWIGMRGKVIEDSVVLRCACSKLAEDGSCGIYATRPQVCRAYEVGGPECRTTVALFRPAQREAIFEAMKP